MEEIEREPFKVTDDGKAEWCMKKIAAADAGLAIMKEWYNQQLKYAQEQHDGEVGYFSGLLRKYFETVPARDTKTMKKYALPSGELVLNKAKHDFVCENPQALLGWCMENDPDLIKVEMTPKWAEIKKRLVKTDAGIVDEKTGLTVVGVVELDKPEEFKVRLKGAE